VPFSYETVTFSGSRADIAHREAEGVAMRTMTSRCPGSSDCHARIESAGAEYI